MFKSKLLVLLSIAVIFGFIVSLILLSIHKENVLEYNEKTAQVLTIPHEIKYYDEVLTMSANMAVLTQQNNWLKRYDSAKEKLDSILRSAKNELPNVANDLHQIDIANQDLIKLEEESLELMKKNRFEDAKEILFSQQYFENKQRYMSALDNLVSNLEKCIEDYKREEEHGLVFLLSSANAAILLVTLIWIVVLILLNKQVLFMNKENKETKDKLTEHKELEDTLRKSEAKWRSLAEHSPDYVSITDPEGVIEYINKTVPELSPEQIIGTPITNYLVDEYVSVAKACFKRVVNSGVEDSYDIEYFDKQGNITCFESYVAPVKDNGKVVSLIISSRDVSKRKQQEQQLMLHMKQAQMGEMISMIAHQWRQPLAAISALIISLQTMMELEKYDLNTQDGREGFKADLTDRLQKVNENIQSLSTTIDDFRNFFRSDKKTEVVALNQPVRKAIDIVGDIFSSNGIEIDDSGLTCKKEVEIYTNELVQVILNILKNAQDNFQEKEIKNPKVTFSCECDDCDDVATMVIKDNGGGIPEDILPKIFDPYFSTKNEKNGTGLGLYMSKIIVEEHLGGKLLVENLDNGASFTIELPVSKSL